MWWLGSNKFGKKDSGTGSQDSSRGIESREVQWIVDVDSSSAGTLSRTRGGSCVE